MDDEFGVEPEDFKDFKNNEMSCDTCNAFMGWKSEGGMEGYICADCGNELEEKYKELHPEEYD